jgi:hypothetical protein
MSGKTAKKLRRELRRIAREEVLRQRKDTKMYLHEVVARSRLRERLWLAWRVLLCRI